MTEAATLATARVTPSAEEGAAAVGVRLAALYRAIAEGPMRGLPIVNPALSVEAVGFRRLGDRVVGVLVTPWCMNLVATAPPEGPALPAASAGATVIHAFPCGDVACTVGEVEGFGRVDAASLFSPMFDFDDAGVVRAVAEAALVELLAAPEAGPTERREGRGAIDRRALLFGRRRGAEEATCR